PFLITGYIQVTFTLFVVGIVTYLVIQFMASVQHDLQLKAEEYSIEITHQVAECTKAYYTNRCMPGERVPAVEAFCKEWEICMGRDPKEVGR
ncbi:Brl1/Brr6 domain-containing protein, partial [Entophlyctis helioformis]